MYHESEEEAFYQLFACRLVEGAFEDAGTNVERLLEMIFEEAKREFPERFLSARNYFLQLVKESEEGLRDELAKADAMGFLFDMPQDVLLRKLNEGFLG